MSKMNRVMFLILGGLVFCSCQEQLNTTDVCKKKFKEAQDLTYTYPDSTRQSALDSALSLSNECLQCDSIRKEAVELKINLLIAMKKYSEGLLFVNSLNDSDFTFGFQKKMMSKSFQALIYDSKSDTDKRNLVYEAMAKDLGQYIKQRQLSDDEFKEIYIYLYTIKEGFLDSNTINKEVEALEIEYPDKATFFEFLKK